MILKHFFGNFPQVKKKFFTFFVRKCWKYLEMSEKCVIFVVRN